MRKWAILEPCDRDTYVFEPRKIMIHPTWEGAFVYLFDAEDALFSRADEFFESEEDAVEAWEEWVSPEGWHVIDDPLPDCQCDCILPVRVKGRDTGNPQWGKYEILENGEWKDFTPEPKDSPDTASGQ